MFGIAPFAFIVALVTALCACGGQSDDMTAPSGAVSGVKPVAQVDTDRIAAAAEEPEMWLTYGGTYDEQRHSALVLSRQSIDQDAHRKMFPVAQANGGTQGAGVNKQQHDGFIGALNRNAKPVAQHHLRTSQARGRPRGGSVRPSRSSF